MTRTRRGVLVVVIAGVALLVVIIARRVPRPISTPPERGSPSAEARPAAYADPALCATCHEDIAPTYAATGMARSFSRVSAGQFPAPARVYHAASDRYYTMTERD